MLSQVLFGKLGKDIVRIQTIMNVIILAYPYTNYAIIKTSHLPGLEFTLSVKSSGMKLRFLDHSQ